MTTVGRICTVCGERGLRADRVLNWRGSLAHARCQPERYAVDAEGGLIVGRRGEVLRGSRDRLGYVQIDVGTPGFRRFQMAHRIVWESVHGPVPDGFELNHINGVKDDNRIANLELVTRGENIAHAYRLGLRSSMKGRRLACQ